MFRPARYGAWFLSMGMLLVSTSCQSRPIPKYQIDVKNPADSVTAVTVKGVPDLGLLEVTSPSGIGTADIALSSGEWPAGLRIRFVYSPQRGFSRLEGLIVTIDGRTLPENSLNHVIFQDAVEVSFPADLLSGARKLRIEWVDMYRN